MNPRRKTTRIRVAARASLVAILLPVLAVLSGSDLHAQSAPTLPAPPVEPPPVALSPFVIEENTDVGYLATSTLAGSRISTPLKDVAAQISVFTPELMRDLGLTNLEEVYLYSTNVESYLQYTPGGDQGAGFGAFQLHNNSRSRGLSAVTNLRNFFSTGFDVDAYNIDRATIASGPNAVLFGIGNPGGITDVTLKRAQFKNVNSVSARWDNFDAHRTTLDLNRVLVPKHLALRVAGLESNNRTFRQPSKDENRRLYGALTWRPFPTTTVRLHSEWHFREAGRAPMILPRDYLTPWVDAGRPEFNNGGITPTSAATVTTGRITAGNFGRVFTRAGATHLFSYGNSAGSGTVSNWINTVTTNGANDNAPKVQDQAIEWSLNRPALFNADYNSYGTAYAVRQRGLTQNVFVEQTLGKSLALEFGYMKEKSDERWGSFINSSTLRVLADANRFLSDGATPNPNFGKLYTQDAMLGARGLEDREDARVSASYALDLTKRAGAMRWLGRHQFVGLFDYYNFTNKSQNHRGKFNGNPTFLSAAAQNSLSVAERLLNTRFYYGNGNNYRVSPLPGGPLDFAEPMRFTSAAGEPFTVSMWHDPDGAWGSPTGTRQNVTSRQLVDQAYLLGDKLIASYGWREDRVRRVTSFDIASTTRRPVRQSNGTTAATGLFPTLEESVFLPGFDAYEDGQSVNWGLVGRPLPWLNLRYASSKNFAIQPNVWFDPFGVPLKGAFGTGKDYGFGLTLWGGKVELRVNQYENTQQNARPDNIISALTTLPKNIEARILDVAPGTPKQGMDLQRYTNANYQTTNTAIARGLDIELIANPSENWRGFMSIGRQRTATTVADTWWRWVDQRLPVWRTFGRGWDGETLTVAGPETVHQAYDRWVATQRDPLIATSGRLVDNQREWRVNGTLTYKFTAEKLRGLSVGGGGRWRSPPSLGYKLKTLASGQEVLDLERKYRGPEELNLDGFASYRLRSARRLGLKTDWRLQLNIRNLLGEDGYVPTQAKTDGTTMVYTYKAPRQFIFSVETEF